MDKPDLTSRERLKTEDQMLEDGAEPEGSLVHNLPNPLGTLHDLPPDLPDFGLFYLSMPQAASLIEDLAAMNRHPFNKLTDIPGSESEKSSQTKRVRLDLVKRLEKQILESIAQGRLAYVRKPGNIIDFIDNGNEQFAARLIYIHYKHLLQWLIRSSYIKSQLLSFCMALNDYASREIGLAKEIAETLKLRRKALYANTLNGDPIGNEEFEEFIGSDFSLNHEDMISQLFDQIHMLTSELQVIQRSGKRQADMPLTERENRSILNVLAAVCKLKGITEWSISLTAKVENLSRQIGHPVTNTTVRKWLKQAIALLNSQ